MVEVVEVLTTRQPASAVWDVLADFDSISQWAPNVDHSSLTTVLMEILRTSEQPHVILEGGGHFLQEDIGGAYTEALMSWIGPAS